MKPAPFEYMRPTTVDAATTMLSRHPDAAVLAGGQSLIALMNLRLATPDVVIDIGRIDDLDSIDVRPDAVVIGAGTRASRVEHDPAVATALPVLRQAIEQIGHPQIRSRTTIGGNIAHADPASELPAVLVGLGGDVELRSDRGTRRVPAADFIEGTFTTSRESDELITQVAFPILAGWRCAFVEFARRPGDFALAGAFVGLSEVDGEIDDCRICLCGVSDVPLRVPDAERMAIGLRLDATSVTAVAEAVRQSITPPNTDGCSSAYRRQLAATVVARAIEHIHPHEEAS